MTEIPLKMGIYSTLVGLLNVKNFDNGRHIINEACDALDEVLRNGDWRGVKLMLRFFAELVNANVILPSTYLGLLDDFLAILPTTPSTSDPRPEAVLYCVLAALPWAGQMLQEREPEGLGKVMETARVFMEGRGQERRVLDAVRMYRDCGEGKPFATIDALDALWAQIQSLQSENWEVPCLLKPHETFDAVLGQGLQKIISYLPPCNSISRFILTDLVSDTLHLLSHNHKEGSALLLRFSDLVNKKWLDAWNTAQRELVQQSESASTTSSSQPDYGNLTLAQATVETILLDLMKLPKSEEKGVYYATVLCDLCRTAPESVPGSMGRALRVLFGRMDMPFVGADEMEGEGEVEGEKAMAGGMDVECVRRLGDWFAHHLSNFGYIWKWEDWESYLTLHPHSARFAFIREVLERTIRLAYYDRIKGTLTQPYFETSSSSVSSNTKANGAGDDTEMKVAEANGGMDEKEKENGNGNAVGRWEKFGSAAKVFPDEAPKINFRYGEGCADPTLMDLANQLLQKMRARASPDDLHSILSKVREHASLKPVDMATDTATTQTNSTGGGLVSDNPDFVAQDVFVQCVMMTGSKSFSHVLNIIERYLPLFQSLNTTPESKARTVHSVYSFWKYNNQFLEIILDKLVNYRVVDVQGIVGWVLDDEVVEEHCSRWFLWAILRNTLNKVNLKISQIQTRLDAARKLHEENEAKRVAEGAVMDDDSGDNTHLSDRTNELNTISQYENAMNAAKREQKEAFLFVYQKFVQLITSKIEALKAEGVEDPRQTLWWRWVVGYMREIGRAFHKEIKTFQVTLETIIFSDEMDARILQ
ncbi:Component of the cap-binding complex (CBC), partial [Quaeritorhiza haematococci]